MHSGIRFTLASLAVVLAGCAEDASTARTMDAATAEHGHRTATPVVPDARRVRVSADMLRFEPAEITVKAGENVALELTSEDMLHDLTMDDGAIHVAAGAGQTAEGGLHVGEPGRYTFYCSVPGHREGGMVGTLIVE